MTAPFDLNLLVVFDTILGERSVTRAAARLNLSQPAVSGCLARLRDVFQDELFVRHQGTMVPTPRALALAAPVRQVVGRIESIREFGRPFDPATSRQVFALSVSDYETTLLAPLIARTLATEAPFMALCLLDNANDSLPDLLTSGAVSFGIDLTQRPHEDIRRSFLLQDAPVAIAARRHPALMAAGLQPGDTLPLDLFCALPHAARVMSLADDGPINRMLAAISRTRQVRLAVSHFAALGPIVRSTNLLACLPGLLAAELARHQPIDTYRIPAELGLHPHDTQLYWHRRDDDVGAHQWVRALITTCAQALAATRPSPDLAPVGHASGHAPSPA